MGGGRERQLIFIDAAGTLFPEYTAHIKRVAFLDTGRWEQDMGEGPIPRRHLGKLLQIGVANL